MHYFIDTDIFLRVFIKSDKKQFDECAAFLTALKENQFDAITGTIILAEIVWQLKSFYEIPKKEIVRRINSIQGINGLKITDEYNQERALKLFEKYSVKYIDSLIASIENIFNKKMTVVSYDRDFDKLPIIRKEPQEIIAKLN